RTGYAAAAGVFTGDAVLMTLAALGAASVLSTTPLLFLVVKYAGAAYLAWMAYGMLRSAWAMWKERGTPAQPAESPAATPATDEHPYRRALIVSLLNPKAILFLISFFVQFVDPGYPYPVLSFVVLGALLQTASFLYLSLLIFSGTRLAEAFRRRRRLAAGATSAAGALFLGFAAKLSRASAWRLPLRGGQRRERPSVLLAGAVPAGSRFGDVRSAPRPGHGSPEPDGREVRVQSVGRVPGPADIAVRADQEDAGAVRLRGRGQGAHPLRCAVRRAGAQQRPVRPAERVEEADAGPRAVGGAVAGAHRAGGRAGLPAERRVPVAECQLPGGRAPARLAAVDAGGQAQHVRRDPAPLLLVGVE